MALQDQPTERVAPGRLLLDALVVLRKHARQELLAEGKRHQAWKLLRSIPTLGPIRMAVLMAYSLGITEFVATN